MSHLSALNLFCTTSGVSDHIFAEAIVDRHDVGIGIPDQLITRPTARRRGHAGIRLLRQHCAAQRGCA
jgi:hypothetical protein